MQRCTVLYSVVVLGHTPLPHISTNSTARSRIHPLDHTSHLIHLACVCGDDGASYHILLVCECYGALSLSHHIHLVSAGNDNSAGAAADSSLGCIMSCHLISGHVMADECSQKWPTHDIIKADTTRCNTAAVTLSTDWSQAVLFCPALLCRQQCTEMYCPAYYKVLYRTLPYCTVLSCLL
jgi:hypothetical protein